MIRVGSGVLLLAAACLGGCGESTAAPGSSLRNLLGAAAPSDSAPRFAKADRVVGFAFPRDHGAHPRFRSEWWYLTAVLATDQGREFGVQFTLFRQGMEPAARKAGTLAGAAAWRTGQVYMAHVAVADIERRSHLEAERFARGHPALAGVTAAPFAAHLEGWRLASTATGFWPLRLQAETPRLAIDLALAGGKPLVLQGDRGLSRKGPDNASYYYSIPRIDAAGSVAVDGKRHAVRGRAWLDREWSTSVLAAEFLGWDWFALSLDDGRDVMLFQLRRGDGVRSDYDGGSVAGAGGAARTLAAADFSLTVADRWRGWPVAWRLVLHGNDAARYTVRAAFEDQVMDTSVRYWEGVVFVYDERGERIGAGYMELTGY